VDTIRGYRNAMGGASDAPLDGESLLFGPGGALDSIGLVSVVVELEQVLAERSGGPVSLMNDRALSRSSSPFRTVGSLAEYAMEQLSAHD